jgi:hypothetical protein
VRNGLREFGLRARRPYIGLPLTRARRACRMAWLAAHGSRKFPMETGLFHRCIPVNLWELLGGRSPPTNSSKGEILCVAFKCTKLYLVVAYMW